jgi:hypothetical protein
MHELINIYAGQNAQRLRQLGQPKWGIVESYNPERHTARVRIQPDDILSGWLHVGTPAVGGLQVTIPPIIGTMALVLLQEGDAEGLSGTLVASGYTDQEIPAAFPSAIGGEATNGQQTELIIHQPGTGSGMRLTSSGTWFIKGDIVHEGNITSSGNTRVMGNIKGDKEITDKLGSVDNLRQHYNSHRHTGVQAGGAQTNLPTVQDP